MGRAVAGSRAVRSCVTRAGTSGARLDEIDSLGFEVRHETVQSLASYTFGMDARASSPLSEPPPPPTERQLPSSAIEENTPRSTFRPTIVDPIGVLAHAADLSEALLLTVSTAVAAAGAEIGLVHRVRHDLHSIVTIGGHGPKTELLLGERCSTTIPPWSRRAPGTRWWASLSSARSAVTCSGASAAVLPGVRGVAMVPLVLFGELVALFEIGRSSQPFRAREVGRPRT